MRLVRRSTGEHAHWETVDHSSAGLAHRARAQSECQPLRGRRRRQPFQFPL